MAEYRTLKMAFWNDPFVESLQPSVKLLYLYLITSPNTNSLGVLEISTRRMAYETGLENEEVLFALDLLSQQGKVVEVDGFIWLTNFVRHQTSTSPKLVAHLKKLVASVSSPILARAIWQRYPDLFDEEPQCPIDTVSTATDTVSIPSGELELELELELGKGKGRGMGRGRGQKTSPGLSPATPSSPPPPPNQPEDIPYQAIVDVYHEVLPELPRVRILTDARRKAIRSRLRSDADRRDLEWWRRYFLAVRPCRFLFGANNRNWTASFDFLISQKGMAGVLEGKYADRKGATATPAGSIAAYVDAMFPDEPDVLDAEVVVGDG